MFARAEELYPGFADQIEAEREEGWVMAYNLGAEAMNEGDTERALARFQGADIASTRAGPRRDWRWGAARPQAGDTEAAISAYRGAMEILEPQPPEGMEEEQLAAWEEIRQVAAFNLANMLAQAGRFGEAADVVGGSWSRAGIPWTGSSAAGDDGPRFVPGPGGPGGGGGGDLRGAAGPAGPGRHGVLPDRHRACSTPASTSGRPSRSPTPHD
jgi:hypothetical protein